jgi:hypothetical protein
VAYQQFQVPCPASQWTQLTEYRPGRKSLMMVCPQVANTFNGGTVSILDDGLAHGLLAADPLRARVVFSLFFVNATTTNICVGPTSGGHGVGLYQSTNTAINSQWDSGIDQIASQNWYGIVSGTGGHAQGIEILTETYQCRAIILATTQNLAVAGGPYGSAPPGNWLSPDLSAGPANFRLQEPLDGEQTIQAWYAWPVGSITVNVTVSEAWDIMQPPPPPEKFSVSLPKLSRDAKLALYDLLGRLGQYDDQEAVNDG